MRVWHKHELIYKRNAEGFMGVECMSCLKFFQIPWGNLQHYTQFQCEPSTGMVTPERLRRLVGEA